MTEGRIIYPGVGEYNGGLKNKFPHGQGVFTLLNGETIKGNFKDGRIGSGKLMFTSGDNTLYLNLSFYPTSPEYVPVLLGIVVKKEKQESLKSQTEDEP